MSAVDIELEATALPNYRAAVHPFREGYQALVEAGYHVHAVHPHDKFPAKYTAHGWQPKAEWNKACDTAPSAVSTAAIARGYACNIGVACGSPIGADHQLVVLDFDVEDPDVLDALLDAAPPSPMRKIGRKGESRFYKASRDIKSTAYDSVSIGRLLDVLAHGRQTVMPPSIHCKTRLPYILPPGASIVPVDELPELTGDHIAALEAVMREHGWTGERKRQGAGKPRAAVDFDGEANIWRQTNQAALDNPDCWFGDLPLDKKHKVGAGHWIAVASYRKSSSNTPDHERDQNLSLHAKGIKDFVTDQGFTALDLVCEACGCDLDTAFKWLRGKLGLDGDDLPADLPEKPRAGNDTARRLTVTTDGTLHDADTGEIVGVETNDNPAPCRDAPFPDHLTRPPGTLGEMVEFVVASAPKPSRALALAVCLVALGSLCGRRDATPTKSNTALYVVGLAVSGVGKQHPQDAAEAMVEAATASRLESIMGPSDLMSEGAFINEIKYRPHSCSFIDEFGELIGKMNAFGAKSFESGIKKILLQVWGKPHAPWKTPSYAKQRGMPIHSPSIAIFGASTPNRFYDAMSGEDRENGFLNRFLIIPELAKGRSVDPTLHWDQVPAELVEKLQAIYEVERETFEIVDEKGKLLDDPWSASEKPHTRDLGWLDDDAKAVFDAYRLECDEAGHFFARSAEMAGRIATIVAVGRDWEFPAVSVEDISYGVELTRWSAEHMGRQASDHVSSGAAGAERSKILRKVKQGGGRVPQSDLLKNLGITAKALAEHVKDMGPGGTGDLVVEMITPAGGGRAKSFLRLADG